MKRRLFLGGMAAAAAAPALAQAPAAGPVRVKLDTADGPIMLELYPDKAPITAGNFLRYVDEKRFDGATFYRASKVPNAPEFGLVQGGVQNDPTRVLKPIAHEPTTKTGLSHTNGAISMGRTSPGTATSDFFICVGDMTYMDADPKQPGDNLGFAAFGKVVEGMDTVQKILAAPTSPTAGEGVMKGEMLAQPVKIVTARRVPG
jgi:peptidyl-prolyl cis-trans isomerase A (cyclophilin A)